MLCLILLILLLSRRCWWGYGYHPYYYGAFVLDPDGHNIEAVSRHPA